MHPQGLDDPALHCRKQLLFWTSDSVLNAIYFPTIHTLIVYQLPIVLPYA